MLEIPQDSFRLYFRDLKGLIDWKKIFQGDIFCDKNLILKFLEQAIARNLIWMMDYFNIFYRNRTSYDFNTPTEEQILYAINNANQTTIQKVGEPGIPFQVFFRPIGENKWIWMPESNTTVCDLNRITELTIYGLEKGVLSNLDRFDIYYKNSKGLPEEVDIDSLINSLIDEMRRKAGKD